MHIMEGYLPPGHAVAWTAAAAPFVAIGLAKVAKKVKNGGEDIVGFAAVGAFTFVLSALKVPSVAGSSSHPVGVTLGSVMSGAAVMTVISFAVLLFQALFIAHGGLTTLGANCFAMGVAGPYAAVFVHRLLVRIGAGQGVSIFAAALAANAATYVTTSAQLGLAFPAATGGFMGSFNTFLVIFAPSQLILMIVEGAFTLLIVRALPGSATGLAASAERLS